MFCFQRRGADLLKEVRKGFGREGLEGLEGRIMTSEDDAKAGSTRVARLQERYRRAAAGRVLLAFMIREDRRWRLAQYEEDILARVPWDEADLSPLFDLDIGDGDRDVELRAGLDADLQPGDPDVHAINAASEEVVDGGGIDYYFAAGHLLDTVPNPWRGAEAARRVFGALLEKHPHGRVVANYRFVLEALRRQLEKERDRLSRQVFAGLLESGAMRFVVVTEDLQFNRLPQRIERSRARQPNRETGGQYQQNLFAEIDEEELNDLENKAATYLNGQARLFFWYRNRSRKDNYMQGLEPRRIYADFVQTLKADEPDVGDGYHRVFVVETKGVHLGQAESTEQKHSIFDVCSEHARRADWAEFVPAMRDNVMRFEVVNEGEWKHRLNAMLT